MNGRDLLVGVVSVAIGLLALAAAVTNRDGFYRLPKAEWLARKTSRRAVRLVYAILGLAMVALGVAIATGAIDRALRGST